MFYAILATIGVSLVSLIGAVLLFKKELIQARYGGLMISIAAGVMLATALTDLLPKALEQSQGKEVYWTLLTGVCVFFVMERLIHWYHHHGHTHDHEIKPAAYLILLGDALHNFFDGIAVATAFAVSVPVGIATTVAIILHEVPQELGDFVALTHSGFSVKKALFYNLISGLTAIMGAVAGWYFLSSVEGALPLLLAFNAGMFIYISCSDLIPSLHEDFKKDKKWLQTIAFLFGVLLMVVMVNTLNV